MEVGKAVQETPTALNQLCQNTYNQLITAVVLLQRCTAVPIIFLTGYATELCHA